jgi:hypothetical protein
MALPFPGVPDDIEFSAERKRVHCNDAAAKRYGLNYFT